MWRANQPGSKPPPGAKGNGRGSVSEGATRSVPGVIRSSFQKKLKASDGRNIAYRPAAVCMELEKALGTCRLRDVLQVVGVGVTAVHRAPGINDLDLPGEVHLVFPRVLVRPRLPELQDQPSGATVDPHELKIGEAAKNPRPPSLVLFHPFGHFRESLGIGVEKALGDDEVVVNAV